MIDKLDGGGRDRWPHGPATSAVQRWAVAGDDLQRVGCSGMAVSAFWEAAGTFLTSPGFGGLAAVVAAVIAFYAAARRVRVDRELAMSSQQQQRDRQNEVDSLAARNETRGRWWQILTWIWSNRQDLDDASLTEALATLADLAETVEQRRMLLVLITALDDGDR